MRRFEESARSAVVIGIADAAESDVEDEPTSDEAAVDDDEL